MIYKLLDYGVDSIYLALDYSNSEVIRAKQVKLVQEIRSIQSSYIAQVEIWYKERNHGIGVGIISAIDWFFSHNENGIILEDDLIFEEDFLLFCSKALNAYENESQILLISGNRYDRNPESSSIAVTNFPQIWGWATWQEKWIEIRKMILSHKNLPVRRLFQKEFCFFFVGAIRALRGEIDTWDLPLAYEMLARNKLCILPDVNLVTNVGSDIHSTHTKSSSFPLNFPTYRTRIEVMPSVLSVSSTVKKSNQFLENNVFGIRYRHILSPLKLLASTFLGKLFSASKPAPLSYRLENAEKFK
jgi:hypothetical protein